MNAFDVAARTLKNYKHPMTVVRLHAVLYFCQAISLERYKRPMFNERIEAWSSGPIVPEVYEMHAGDHKVSLESIEFYKSDIKRTEVEHEIMKEVYRDYGIATTGDLKHKILNEGPWAELRVGLAEHEHCTRVITRDSMQYRQSLAFE